jgi:hypothetical protein
VSYGRSDCIARQVRVVRGRSGRLGAIPCGPTLGTMPHVIAEFDAAGDVVGVQIEGISAETLSLADEFLGLLDLSLPLQLTRTILG